MTTATETVSKIILDPVVKPPRPFGANSNADIERVAEELHYTYQRTAPGWTPFANLPTSVRDWYFEIAAKAAVYTPPQFYETVADEDPFDDDDDGKAGDVPTPPPPPTHVRARVLEVSVELPEPEPTAPIPPAKPAKPKAKRRRLRGLDEA